MGLTLSLNVSSFWTLTTLTLPQVFIWLWNSLDSWYQNKLQNRWSLNSIYLQDFYYAIGKEFANIAEIHLASILAMIKLQRCGLFANARTSCCSDEELVIPCMSSRAASVTSGLVEWSMT